MKQALGDHFKDNPQWLSAARQDVRESQDYKTNRDTNRRMGSPSLDRLREFFAFHGKREVSASSRVPADAATRRAAR
ncbi:hypothetical protein GCM10017559_49990 [Streptosporangium longisporum]|uniref:Uncharacterized protein n=1 Tax=Streptosporangium longisporum TaxID=46187 RepID=A0ABP6KRN3_9ACTN